MDNSTLAFASLRDEQDSSGSHETSMVDAAGNGTSLQYGPDVTSAAFSLNSYVDQDPQQEMPQLPAPLREKTSFCCEIDTAFTSAATQKFLPPIQSDISLRDQPRPAIEITEAVKAHDMSGISYIAYVIHTRLPEYNISLEAKHRYSEFESLRKLLTKAYPTSVVPPIPEKHTVAAYAAKPGKAKEDPHIILLRKRMLQTFLNRVASHPILSSSHVFHLFIKGIAPWSEILTSSGLAHLLKRKDTILPVSEKSVLRKPDAHFVAAEDYTIRFMSQILYIEKIHKRIITHHTEMATTYADLGGSYNGWSLTESTLADSIEQTGQAIDSTVTATNAMRLQLQERFDEMLHEYALFSLNIEKLLRWRHRKHAEFEGISESLILKQAALVRLEQAEHESLRLSAALNSESGGGGYTSSAISASNHDWSTAATTTTTSTATTDHYSSGGSIPPSVSDPHSSATRFNETDVDHNGLAATTASTTPTLLNSQYGAGAAIATSAPQTIPYSAQHPYPSRYTNTSNPALAASTSLIATFNSLMDNDPQVTRRNQISKTRDGIVQLESQREMTRQELLVANAEIQHDLDRFQRQKIVDIRDLLCGLAVTMKEFHVRALNAWKGARETMCAGE